MPHPTADDAVYFFTYCCSDALQLARNEAIADAARAREECEKQRTDYERKIKVPATETLLLWHGNTVHAPGFGRIEC